MAKFKVGDKFVHRNFNGRRARGVVTKVGPVSYAKPEYEADIQLEDGKIAHRVTVSESDMIVSNSAPRSTNPVVQNALKAKACNGINDWWGFRKGDKVRAKYWKNPNAVGIVTGLASMGGASDGSDTFLFVDFPTEKNVSCSIKELVRNSTVAANRGIDNPAELKAAANLIKAINDAKKNIGEGTLEVQLDQDR